jgi:hypothetical protein
MAPFEGNGQIPLESNYKWIKAIIPLSGSIVGVKVVKRH